MHGLLPYTEEMALDACQSVFHSNQYWPSAAVPNLSVCVCVCVCVCVHVCVCQSLVSYRDRIEEKRGQMKSEVMIIAH